MTLIVTIVIVVAGIFGIGSTIYLGKDNPIEQCAEQLIDYELGVPPGTVQLPDLSGMYKKSQVPTIEASAVVAPKELPKP